MPPSVERLLIVAAFLFPLLPASAFSRDHDYVYVGAELGYARSSAASSDAFENGFAFGPVRVSALYSYFAFDLTGLGFVKGTPVGGGSKTRLITGMTLDLSVGYPFGPVFVGVAPYAWTWAKDTADGLGLVVKAHLHVDALAGFLFVEARAVPYAYFKGYSTSHSWWENNLSIGASWMHDDGLLAGLRYTRLGDQDLVTAVVGWGWAK